MKKIALTVLLFALTFGVAGAASVNGDFEGNPIVKVQSAGQDLKVEDVPATIYKGRTVVPVYLLRQLGANIVWNGDTYTVNVTMPNNGNAQQPQQPQPDAAQQERELLKKAYEWLRDTDTSMLLYVQELQQFAAMDMTDSNAALIDLDFKKLNDTYNLSYQMTQKVQEQVKDSDGLRSIIASELQTLEDITQAKNYVLLKKTVSGTDFTSRLPGVMLNATRSVMKNQMNTNDLLHKLQAQEMKLN